MFERFTDRARRVVVLAQLEARRLSHDYIGTEHLLLGLISDGQGVAAHVLADAGITLDAARAEVLGAVGRGERPQSGHVPFTPRAKKILELALREALELGSDHIGTEHLLLGLIREGEGVGAQVAGRLGGGLEELRAAVVAFAERQSSSDPEPPPDHGPGERRSGRRERGAAAADPGGPFVGSPGPHRALLRGMFQRREGAPVAGLREYVPGTARPAERRDTPVVERAEPTRRLLAALGRHEHNNALIIGPPGSGKTALVRGAARAAVGNRGPAALHGMELVELDGAVLRAGVDRLVRCTVAAVVLVEDLDTLLAADEVAGGRLVLGLAALATSGSPLVLTVTDAGYGRFAHAYPLLAQRFAEVRLDAADAAFTREVLLALRPRLASFHNVVIEDSALDAAIELGPGAVPGRAMPGCAVDLLDTAAARASAPARSAQDTQEDAAPPVLDARRLRRLITETETGTDAAAGTGTGTETGNETGTENETGPTDGPAPAR